MQVRSSPPKSGLVSYLHQAYIGVSDHKWSETLSICTKLVWVSFELLRDGYSSILAEYGSRCAKGYGNFSIDNSPGRSNGPMETFVRRITAAFYGRGVFVRRYIILTLIQEIFVRRDEGYDDMPAHVKSSLLNSHVSGGANAFTWLRMRVCVFVCKVFCTASIIPWVVTQVSTHLICSSHHQWPFEFRHVAGNLAVRTSKCRGSTKRGYHDDWISWIVLLRIVSSWMIVQHVVLVV